MNKYKKILKIVSALTACLCYCLASIRPISAEGSFSETYWINQEAYSFYEMLRLIGLTTGATGNTLSLEGNINLTLQSITMSNGSSSISLTGQEVLTSQGLTAYSTYLSQNPLTPIITNYRLGTSNEDTAEISCAETQTVNGLTTYDGEGYANYVNRSACTVTFNDDASNQQLYLVPDQLKVSTRILGAVYDDNGNLLEGGSIRITGTNSNTGSQAFSFAGNESGTLTGSFNLSGLGTWLYQLPWLSFETAQLGLSYHSGTTDYPNLWGNSRGTTYFSFILPAEQSADDLEVDQWRDWMYSNLRFITSNGDPVSYSVDSVNNTFTSQNTGSAAVGSGFRKVLITLPLPAGQMVQPCFSQSWIDLKLVPLYMGDGMDISDDYRRFIGLSDRVLDELGKTRLLIQNGDGETSQIVDDAGGAISDFGGASDDLIGAEDSAFTDFESNLGSIDHSSIIGQLSQFNNGINWVVVQYEALITNTPFVALISISLLLAMAAVLVGRL